jgi:chromate transporter
VPVTIGLVCASAYVIARTADTSAALFAVTAATAAGLYATRLHPMLFLAGGAALGLGGLLR